MKENQHVIVAYIVLLVATAVAYTVPTPLSAVIAVFSFLNLFHTRYSVNQKKSDSADLGTTADDIALLNRRLENVETDLGGVRVSMGWEPTGRMGGR